MSGAGDDAPVAVLVLHRARPGQRDAVREVWMRSMAPAVQVHAGHRSYCLAYDADDVDVICAFQIYASPQAARDFLRHPDYLAYCARVEPLLDGPPQVRTLRPQWMKS